MATPKYRLTEKAYLNEILYDPEDPKYAKKPHEFEDGEEPFRPCIVEYDGIPAHYMVPVNDEAREMMKKYPPRTNNAIDQLTIVGPAGKTMEQIDAERDAVEAQRLEKTRVPANKPAARKSAAK
jgi:hypothetical protein